jgi:polygalacturonase
MSKYPALYLTFAFSFCCSVCFAQNHSVEIPYSWDHLPQVIRPVFKKDTINILEYSAKPDGTTLNTQAITKAIAECNKKGGGVVLIPAGLWLTGPITLKSNVNLHLVRGATLFFTTDKSQYELVEGDYEGRSAARNQSPINGINLENIAITGNGIIDGNGDVWRGVNKNQLTAGAWAAKIASGGVLSEDKKSWYPSGQFKRAQVEGKSMLLMPGKSIQSFADMKDFLRPNLLVLKNCSKVLLDGITFQNSAAWCLHPIICDNLTISDVLVKNPNYAQNGDGMDIESCKNFIIENSILDVGDDAICIKSGKDEEGRKRGKPTENGIIRNNTVYEGHGGVVVGSEMSGGARNLFIENCTFIGTDKGLRFKSVRGRGGVVENIFARNIYMKNIVQEAIFFDMLYFLKFATDSKRDMTPVINEGTPVFRNMVFDKVVCNGANKALFIRGLSEMKINNITLSNSVITANSGIELMEASAIIIKNVQVFTNKNSPVVFLQNSNNISLDSVGYKQGSNVFVSLDGTQNKDIKVSKTDVSKSLKSIELLNGAALQSITVK